MPRKKSRIFTVLKPSHLQAIGRVAAEWSKLEFIFQMAISDTASLDIFKTLIITKPSNIGGWMDMLQNMISHVYGDSKAQKELEDVYKTITKLQKERNAIVHTFWTPQTTSATKGIIGALLAIPTSVSHVASGLGFPKRGKNVAVNVTKTAAEMRKVAKEIEAVTYQLHQVVYDMQQRALRHKPIVEALLASPTQGQPKPNKP